MGCAVVCAAGAAALADAAAAAAMVLALAVILAVAAAVAAVLLHFITALMAAILVACVPALWVTVRLVKHGSVAEVFRRHRRPAQAELEASPAPVALPAGSSLRALEAPAIEVTPEMMIGKVKEEAGHGRQELQQRQRAQRVQRAREPGVADSHRGPARRR